MSITRLKLQQYLAVMRTHIPPGRSRASDNVHQAMDGIEELCALLQLRPEQLAYQMPVERAFEAAHDDNNADGELNSDEKTAAALPPLAMSARNRTLSGSTSSQSPAVRSTTDDFEIVVHPNAGGIVDQLAYVTADANDRPQARRRSSVTSSTTQRYEIPDDRLMLSRKASKILGDRREVEMHEFRARRTDDSEGGGGFVVPAVPAEDPAGERPLD